MEETLSFGLKILLDFLIKRVFLILGDLLKPGILSGNNNLVLHLEVLGEPK